jgi:elongation factor 3
MCRLTEYGFSKLINELDMKEAARQGLLGLGSKPLDSDHIQQHLADFGLDAEFSTHSRMRGLSGRAWKTHPWLHACQCSGLASC